MPTYQYACTDPECGNRFELVQSFTDPAASTCPVCGGPVRKVFSSVGVVFKGSGFYRNDSREAANKGAAKNDSAKSDAKSESSASASSSESSSGSDSSGSSKSDSAKSTGSKSESSGSSSSDSGSSSTSKSSGSTPPVAAAS